MSRRLVRDLRATIGLAFGLARDLSGVEIRHPRLALEVGRAALRRPRDPAALALVDRALEVRRGSALLRWRALLLGSAGELSASRATWRELATRGDRRAAGRARMIEGALIETDPRWLPIVEGPREPLEPLNRRRILHIMKSSVPDRWSGFTIRSLYNLRAQRDAGLEPLAVTEPGFPRNLGAADVPPIVVVEGIAHHRLDRGAGYDPRSLPADVRLRDMTAELIPLVRELRPAILHAHSGHRGGEHALVALALRERFGIPVVYEIRGLFESAWTSDLGRAERSETYARRFAQETRIMREADGVIAICEALADELSSRGIPRGKIAVVPNAIDPAAFVDRERDPGLRARLGLAGHPVVGYVGNLDHVREGLEGLVLALASLRASGRRDIALLIVGDGYRRTHLQAHARRLGVADRCVFTGRVPHERIADYYAQMDLFVNPRIDERAARYITPLKPYEAMALGIPVLVTDLPALREIVDPPHRGAVAPVGDVAGLAAAIADLIDDPERRGRLGAAGRSWVRRERTWASNGARYRAVYEGILGPLD